jgi:hypothetical protein
LDSLDEEDQKSYYCVGGFTDFKTAITGLESEVSPDSAKLSILTSLLPVFTVSANSSSNIAQLSNSSLDFSHLWGISFVAIKVGLLND